MYRYLNVYSVLNSFNNNFCKIIQKPNSLLNNR